MTESILNRFHFDMTVTVRRAIINCLLSRSDNHTFVCVPLIEFEVFDHEAIRGNVKTFFDVYIIDIRSSVFAQLPIHSLLCFHNKILKNEVTRTAVRTLLSSNLSCSSLEIRAVNAEISSASDVKLNSLAKRLLSTKEAEV